MAGMRKEDELSAIGSVVATRTGNCNHTGMAVGGIARVWIRRALDKTLAGE